MNIRNFSYLLDFREFFFNNEFNECGESFLMGKPDE